MFFQSIKKLAWIVVFWFALLQVIAPFIHAHLGAEHLTETATLHVHADEHEHFDTHNDSNNHVADLSHAMQTVTVTDGFINDLENSFALYAVLYVLCFLLVRANLIIRFHPVSNSLQDYSIKWRSPAPRAPPQL